MATRKFNSTDEFKSWLSSTLILFVDRQSACLNGIELDTYPERYHACDILHDFASGCWCAAYQVEKVLKGFVSSVSDPYSITDDYSRFLSNPPLSIFDSTANYSFGCCLLYILCSFLDSLEVEVKDGVLYVEY